MFVPALLHIRYSFVHTHRLAIVIYVKRYSEILNGKGVATSRTTLYNREGNGQVKHLNRTLWKTNLHAFKSQSLPVTQRESILLNAFHSISSLLCIATTATQREIMFIYIRRSTTGTAVSMGLTSLG